MTDLSPETVRAMILKAALGHNFNVINPMPIPAVEIFAAELDRMRADGLIFGSEKEPRLTAAGVEAASPGEHVATENAAA